MRAGRQLIKKIQAITPGLRYLSICGDLRPGQTLAGLSHCIKNILQGIKGGAYILDLGLQKDNIERVRQGWEEPAPHDTSPIADAGRVLGVVLHIDASDELWEPMAAQADAVFELRERASVEHAAVLDGAVELARDAGRPERADWAARRARRLWVLLGREEKIGALDQRQRQ